MVCGDVRLTQRARLLPEGEADIKLQKETRRTRNALRPTCGGDMGSHVQKRGQALRGKWRKARSHLGVCALAAQSLADTPAALRIACCWERLGRLMATRRIQSNSLESWPEVVERLPRERRITRE